MSEIAYLQGTTSISTRASILPQPRQGRQETPSRA
jgi:hypothetical protein